MLARLYYLLLFIVPFNALPIGILGSVGSEGALYIILLFVLIWPLGLLVRDGRFFVINKKLLIALAISSLSIFISFIFNYQTISSSEHMDKLGAIKFIVEYVQLLLSLFLVLIVLFFNRSEEMLLKTIKFLYFIVIFHIFYSFFQYFSFLYGGGALNFYKLFSSFIYKEEIVQGLSSDHRLRRIYSVCQEPSFLVMFLSVIVPFVIAQQFTQKKYIITILLAIIIFLTFSRTGYVIFLFQIILLIFFFRYGFFNIKKIPLALFAFIICFLFVLGTGLLSNIIEIENNYSNIARYAGMYSSLLAWLDNNILLGVGLGQAGFISYQYLPAWAMESTFTQDVLLHSRWPGIYNMWMKILLELGLLGLIIWMSFYFYILKKVHDIIKIKARYHLPNIWIGHSVYVSFSAVPLIMLTRENIFNPSIWLSVGFALSYIGIYKRNIVSSGLWNRGKVTALKNCNGLGNPTEN